MASNVLVFPCGSEIGLEIHNALRWSKDFILYGASSVTSNHGKFTFQNYVEGIPFVNEPQFLASLKRLINTLRIDFIFPAHDSVVFTLANINTILECKVISSPKETCLVARSKKKTYGFLTDRQIPVPKLYDPTSLISGWPVFLKPDVGQGSKGTCLAHDREEMHFYLKRNPSLLVMEYLPGPEFTVDCFTDRHGQLRFIGARERVRIQNGISVHTRPISSERITQLAHAINQALRFRGAWFFQIKEGTEQELKVMEIAPRIAGSMGLYRNLGVNLALLSLYDAQDIDVDLLVNNHSLEMDRAFISRFQTDLDFDHVYVDLDDTILINGKINTMLLSFIFQCINDKKKVHLLTRNQQDISVILNEYRLQGIFDTINVVGEAETKAAHIHASRSIFIDDSFSERMDVRNRLGIPVFGIDAVESLLNWKG